MDVTVEVFQIPDTTTPVLTDTLDFCVTSIDHELDPGQYRVKAVNVATGEEKQADITVTEATVTSLDFDFAPTPRPPILATLGGAGLGAAIGYALKPDAPFVSMVVGGAVGGAVGFIIDRACS